MRNHEKFANSQNRKLRILDPKMLLQIQFRLRFYLQPVLILEDIWYQKERNKTEKKKKTFACNLDQLIVKGDF